ncbi:hypothetical protein [Nitrospirillum amazonense]|uniref:hypothetical protein n=1 Tax=Nitrospirillum amazonense TaxID=28077 RepID=UPI0024124401|nr:hypothetical protein [Nitrospirillum amazonense]MDG3444660.1 hypothetical protein [Nitrospirillum amazonense]
MPDFIDFVDQLESAGVVFEGRATLLDRCAEAASWREEFAFLAARGRKEEVRFIGGHVDTEVLRRIVRGYDLTPVQEHAVLGALGQAWANAKPGPLLPFLGLAGGAQEPSTKITR